MSKLTDVQYMTEITPGGGKLRYLLSGARVYASAKSWQKALQVPETLSVWFVEGLSRTALLKKSFSGGELEMLYQGVAVYRWHAVADLLRAFDRKWYEHGYKTRIKPERDAIQRFHDNYENLVAWGYDLQERALSSALVAATPSSTPVTEDVLLDAIKSAVAPRLHAHDDKIKEHDLVISEMKGAIPTLRDEGEFITVRQAILEQGLDPAYMPLYPSSRENISGLAGQLLRDRGVEIGGQVVARVDGRSVEMATNTYRRVEIYKVLKEVIMHKQESML